MIRKKILLGIAFIILIPVVSSAMSISIGPYAWYAWWDAALEEAFKKNTIMQYKINNETDIDPAILYGAALSLKFNERISLSTVFITGEYNITSRGYETGPTLGWTQIYADYSQSFRRYDVDSALNYKISDNMKLFGGIKYQLYSFDTFYSWGAAGYADGTIIINGISFALGAGFNWHLGSNFFLLFNLSALYQLNLLDSEGTMYSGALSMPLSHSEQYHAMGANSTLSIAYYLDAISTTLTVGFRYQVVYLFDNGSVEFPDFSNEFDHFYGITFSALYTFDF
jgi:hypothetical protein